MPVAARILGESPAIAAVREQAERLLRSASTPARRPPPVLILGETGTGKGLLADALHRAGARAAGPFVDVNCAAIPEALLEAELFGFERGAFTDARQAKPGLFQAARGGSVFLDEIGLLPLALQSKLLKAIEERAVRRLGSVRSEAIDAAVIAATSEDLAAAVERGRFRADLYHRLAVVTLVLPPLRARGHDVVLLAEHFLARACEDYGLPPRVLGDDARAALLAHAWPGNVRELANAIERAALFADERVLTAGALALPAPSRERDRPEPPVPPGPATEADDAEKRALLEVLTATGWNFTHAAARIGVPRNTLRYRAERLGLAPDVAGQRRRGGRPPGRPAPPASPSPATEGTAEVRRVTLLEIRLVPEPPAGWEATRPLEASAAKVRAFGGQVEDLDAGALLAAFGLEPDEDAPRRAAYAALAVRALGERARERAADVPRVKVALHTGAVAVTAEGRVDAERAGPARAALASLVARAAPGTVVASAAAARLLAHRVETVPLPPGGGEAGAVEITRRTEPRWTRFVGRERELRLLGECFALAGRGQGQVVLIAGEAGIGKSRLLRELRRRLGREATWVEGQAVSFGRAMPLHPVIDMLRRVFRVEDADAEGVVVAKLERAVRQLGDDLDAALPLLRYLLSIDPGDRSVLAMDPRRRQDAITAATHLLLERGAARRPHVVVLEDLHWCDPATEDWITRLVDRIADQRVLVLLTYRPGYRPAFASGGGHTALALSTLSGEESLRVARSLLDTEDLPPALGELVVNKAEGNPFFIEELVRSLVELGAVRRTDAGLVLAAELDGVAVPDTVQDVILARAHRLDEGLRRILDVAAVIGRTVPLPLLCAVTGGDESAVASALRRLEAAEFLRETRAFPEVEYRFKHALTQDVAYGRVAPAARRALHAQIVGAIEALSPDRLAEHVERLADHATRGELWPAAARYARQAGAKAFDRSANREAVAWFEQALAALAHLPPGPEALAEAIDIRLLLRSALLQLAELAAIGVRLREAETLATVLGDRRRLAWVWTYMTITHLFAGELGEALAVGERALALAEEVGDVGLRASARTPLAHACRERGDYPRAVGLFREAIALLSGDLLQERLGQAMPPSFYARSMAAFCLAELGEFAEAVRLATESARQTEALDLPFGLAMARMALGHTALAEGRLDEAAKTLDEAIALLEARGIPTWHPWATALRGYTAALAGQAAEGQRRLEGAIDRALALGFLFGHSQWLAWLAHAHLLAGRPDEARGRAAEALDLSRRRGERGYEAWAVFVEAEIAAHAGAELGDAAARYGDALALATALGMAPLAARCRDAMARLRA